MGVLRNINYGLAVLVSSITIATAQQRPYVGYAYPSGGQRGTTFTVNLGGQYLDDVCFVNVTGTGVRGRIVDYQRQLNAQEITLLREQLAELTEKRKTEKDNIESNNLIARLEKRIAEYVQQPQSVSIANKLFAEVTIDPDALPGEREIRVYSHRNISNPLPFYVGQIPEFTLEPMTTTPIQILGKEADALEKVKKRKLITPTQPNTQSSEEQKK